MNDVLGHLGVAFNPRDGVVRACARQSVRPRMQERVASVFQGNHLMTLLHARVHVLRRSDPPMFCSGYFMSQFHAAHPEPL